RGDEDDDLAVDVTQLDDFGLLVDWAPEASFTPSLLSSVMPRMPLPPNPGLMRRGTLMLTVSPSLRLEMPAAQFRA
ncbi:hypothetical protein, partial [Klebsiella michiganensis]|uniref:hypothetical protein n=1 Tax=Klebsiella michiganensis TaxID=1134687 RepID=UPI00195304D6